MTDTATAEADSVIARCAERIERHHDEVLAFAKELKAAAKPFLEAYDKQHVGLPAVVVQDDQIALLAIEVGDLRRLRQAMAWKGGA